MKNNLISVWRSGRVRRWHTHAYLSDTNDRTDGHSARVTIMALWLRPQMPREALISALLHDSGEYRTGDWGYDFKAANPDMRQQCSLMELEAVECLGFHVPVVSSEYQMLIKMCDWLDSWIWAAHHEPHIVQRSDWIAQKDRCIETARTLDCEDQVASLFRDLSPKEAD